LKDIAYKLRATGWFLDVAEMLAAERIIVLDKDGKLYNWTLGEAKTNLKFLKLIRNP
jgi:hypothetical protein